MAHHHTGQTTRFFTRYAIQKIPWVAVGPMTSLSHPLHWAIIPVIVGLYHPLYLPLKVLRSSTNNTNLIFGPVFCFKVFINSILE